MDINVQFSDEELIHKIQIKEQAGFSELRESQLVLFICILMNYDVAEKQTFMSAHSPADESNQLKIRI